MDLSQLDFKSHLDAPKGTIYLQPMKVALKKDHFYRSVYLAWMDPQRFPEEAIKIVAELLLPKWSWLNCLFSLLLPRGGNRVLSTSQVLGTNTHPSQSFFNEKNNLSEDVGWPQCLQTSELELWILVWIWMILLMLLSRVETMVRSMLKSKRHLRLVLGAFA